MTSQLLLHSILLLFSALSRRRPGDGAAANVTRRAADDDGVLRERFTMHFLTSDRRVWRAPQSGKHTNKTMLFVLLHQKGETHATQPRGLAIQNTMCNVKQKATHW